MSEDVRIKNIVAKNKGCLILQCDVELVKLGLVWHEVKYFEKGQNAWIQNPSRQWKEGEEWMTKYMVSYMDNDWKERYRKPICKAIQEAIKDGIPEPSLPTAQEASIFDDENVPF